METERKPRSLLLARFFLPAWKWLVAVPPWLYGWFAFIRDEFLPSHIREYWRIGGVLDMIAWYWWVIVGLSALLVITVLYKSKPQAIAVMNQKARVTPAWVINARLMDTPHKCTFCGFSYSLMPNDLGENTACYIKEAICPKCSNVDFVSRYYGPPGRSAVAAAEHALPPDGLQDGRAECVKKGKYFYWFITLPKHPQVKCKSFTSPFTALGYTFLITKMSVIIFFTEGYAILKSLVGNRLSRSQCGSNS
jgi:hypothetical protein